MKNLQSTLWQNLRTRWPRAAAVAVALTGALALSGCYGGYGYSVGASVPVGVSAGFDVPLVAVDSAPLYIDTYPRYSYRGSYVYLVGNSWYYPSGGRWYTLRGEPRELARYRSTYRGGYAYPRGGGYSTPGYAYPGGGYSTPRRGGYSTPDYAYPSDRRGTPGGVYRGSPSGQRRYSPSTPGYHGPSRGGGAYERGRQYSPR